MDELDKKAQKGLEAFSKKGDIRSVKSALDGMVDDMLGDDEEVIQEKGKPKYTKWLFLAAAVVGLFLIGYLGFRDGKEEAKKLSPPAIYAQYFEVLPNVNGAGERGEEASLVLSYTDIAMKMYEEGNYKGAAQVLKDANEPEYLVYGGIAEMKNENFVSAIDIFSRVQGMDKSLQYKDIVSWYLSLAYLENGEVEAAKEGFDEIAKSTHYKKNEASAILKMLE